MISALGSHMIAVFFVYGLAFFSLGLAVLIYPKKNSSFELARPLWFLGMFGLLHGGVEWIDMAQLIAHSRSAIVTWVRGTALVASLGFLLQFGIQLVVLDERLPRRVATGLRIMPFALATICLTLMIAIPGQPVGEVLARYLLCLPGAVVGAWMLLRQRDRLGGAASRRIVFHLDLAAVSLGLYGVFAGMIVPRATFFPASTINGPAFQHFAHFPVQIARTLCAVGVTYGTLRLLGIFGWEANAAIVANTRLQLEKESAEEIARTKSQFLANMSHEIRTPMNGVIGLIDLLVRTPLDSRQRRYAETIRGCGNALLCIIDDVLDFSRLEAEKMKLHVTDLDLRAVLEDVADSLATRAHAKGLEVACMIQHDVPTALRGDPQRLRQILSNLTANAVKFTEHGEVILRARLERNDGDRSVVRFEVTDTGIGISEQGVAQLFKSFSQVDSSHTRSFGGAGLGLAISKRLTELMGGEMGVQSEPGKGSTFWFVVPFERQSTNSRAQEAPRAELKGCRVLVVDDNATNREILAGLLAPWEMKVQCVDSAPLAVDVLRASQRSGDPFDVALIDMQMPGMDGLSLARVVHSDATLVGLRLVMLTSVSDQMVADEAERSGIHAFLTKPIRESLLFQCLQTVLGQTSGANASAPLLTEAEIRALNLTHKPRILVAEDNKVNQQVAVEMLTALGCTVDLANDGRQACAAIEKTDYDCVLMDCQMPGMSGYDATEAVRERERTTGGKRTTIVALTAHALESERQRALSIGMDDYLVKPVTMEALSAMLQRRITRPRSDRPVASEAGVSSEPATPQAANENEPLLKPGIKRSKALVGIFLEESPVRVAALHEALGKSDAEALRHAAHKFKGSALALGVPVLTSHCLELETAARTGDFTPAAALISKIESVSAAVDRELRTLQ